tara:strand:- start:13 stop:528 length:516 start_codon:yes stop_codon:yes gene_type:complete
LTNRSDNNGFNSKGFDYDSLVEESLKGVVKKVLKITSETGLVGNSHFFITFNGNDPDVKVPSELKDHNNSEIKIIIQHQFWDLKTTNEHFEVTLSFNGEKKNIFVPFKAITSFTDPSVGFGLQFKIEDNLKDNNLNIGESSNLDKPKIAHSENTDVKSGEIVSLDEFRDKK